METTMVGTVVRIKGRDYFVALGEKEYRCTIRGKFRIKGVVEGSIPVVGDRVEVRVDESLPSNEPQGLITNVLPRKSVFRRVDPSNRQRSRVIASNIDEVCLVFSIREPELNRRMLDRMIVAAESEGIEPVICINKMDLTENRDSAERNMLVYSSLGYRTIYTSTVTGEGIDELKNIMLNKISILTGPSGSGKSSLIARIQPGLELKVGSVSSRTGKGRHTTTHFELHRLDEGGYIADTPGIREFGIYGVAKEELSRYFREFASFEGQCRFSPCTHSHEPGCSVKKALEEGLIDGERYGSYLRILESLETLRSWKK